MTATELLSKQDQDILQDQLKNSNSELAQLRAAYSDLLERHNEMTESLQAIRAKFLYQNTIIDKLINGVRATAPRRSRHEFDEAAM